MMMALLMAKIARKTSDQGFQNEVNILGRWKTTKQLGT